MPAVKPGETRSAYVSRCMSSAEAKRTQPDDKARVGLCEGLYDEHEKRQREGKSPNESNMNVKEFSLDELIDFVRGRKSLGLSGIRTAGPYVKALHVCLTHSGMCPKSLFGLSTDEWAQFVKDADAALTYTADDLVIKEAGIRSSGLTVPKSILEFDHFITTTRRDRDGDLLEAGGAELDPKMPLLAFHNQSQPLGPYVKTIRHDADAIEGTSAILDTSYGRDMAILVEGKALRISHGFTPVKFEPMEMVKGQDGKEYPKGFHVKNFKIREVSLVSVPANEDAVITSYSKGMFHDPFIKAWAARKYENRPTRHAVPVEIQIKSGNVVTKGHYTFREESDGRVALVSQPDGKTVAHAANMQEAHRVAHDREVFEHMRGHGGEGKSAADAANLSEKRTISNPPPNELDGAHPEGRGSNAEPSPGIDSARCPNCNTPVSRTGETFVSSGMDQGVFQCSACGLVFAAIRGTEPGAETAEHNANGRGNSNPAGSSPKTPMVSGDGARKPDPLAREIAFQEPGAMPARPAAGPRQPMLNGRASIADDLATKAAGTHVPARHSDKVMAAHNHAKAAAEHLHGVLRDSGHEPNEDGEYFQPSDPYNYGDRNPADPNNDHDADDKSHGQPLSTKAKRSLSHANADRIKVAHMRAQVAADHLHSVLVDTGHEPLTGDGKAKASGAADNGYGQGGGDARMSGNAEHAGGSGTSDVRKPAGKRGEKEKSADDLLTVKATKAGTTELALENKLLGMESYMPGSFEWISSRLERTAPAYLQARGFDGGDYVREMATFPDGTAIICIRDWSQPVAQCYRVAWEMKDGQPQWTGDVARVEIQPQVIEKMFAGTLKQKSSLVASETRGMLARTFTDADAIKSLTIEREMSETIGEAFKNLSEAGEFAATLQRQQGDLELSALLSN